MLLYKTTSLNALISPYPTRLHSYNVNGSMSFPTKPSLRLSQSQTPLSRRSPKLTRGGDIRINRNSHKTPNFTVRASNETPPVLHFTSSSNNSKLVLISSAITVTLAVANRVLYKLALVPMKQYPFFLAQFTTFGYVMIYFSILFMRYRAGIVTGEMIGLPKSRFVAIGILEALGVATGMSAAAMLPGPAIPILSQTFLVWQLAFSALLLGRRYSFKQITGCMLVAFGVVVAVASGSSADQMLSGFEFIWPAVMIISSAFQAGASIIKALFVLLLLPLLSNLKGIPFAQLPSYMKSGAGCLVNIGRNIPGCNGAPLLPLLYVTMNMAFNVSLLNLVKISSAVVASLAVMLSVPISIYVLSLPLPYLPEGASLSPFFLLGSTILVLGLVLYNVARPVKQASN
ncbi:protein CLT2, chloroplastic isoform X2 [Hevea brasiliensis]|uniref:protein CLT2, chloroplastic isoform X2 n=1 Tax=Hevea brasiliensis TaxID=3981 RepID=UPI0025FBD0CA|nr:protein CLT2, chloroplastic isoform X2 [Hevea brasiliensis]